MPVHQVKKGNRIGWRWGDHGKIYFGKGAKQKAEKQGRAAYSSGYKLKKK